MTAARRSSRRPASGRGRKDGRSWLLPLSILVLAAAGAAWWFGAFSSTPIAPPLDEHDEESRARLEAVLREADREERAR